MINVQKLFENKKIHMFDKFVEDSDSTCKMNIYFSTIVFAFALLNRSPASAQEMMPIIPDGIVEHFIDPYKVGAPEFPDGSVAEMVPAVTQNPDELAESLNEEDSDEAQVTAQMLPGGEVQVLPGGIAEQFADPYKKIPEVSTEVTAAEIDEADTKEASVELVPGGVFEQFIDPHQARKIEVAKQPAEIATQSPTADTSEEMASQSEICCDPEKKWYFEIKPGYYLLTDKDMREFFGHGGFTARVQAGCKVWGPMIVWFDGGYFQKSGTAIGGTEELELKLATITLGLKGIYYWNDYVAMYAGAGPRLFMMMMKNDSPFVRGDDNEIGIGGGFDAGFWFFPIPQWKSFFLDLFADYSWKKMKVEEDEISSDDFDVDVSGLSIGIGLGIKF